MMNFFVLLKDEQILIQRLSLEQKLQNELSQLFSNQQEIMFPKDREISEFCPGYQPDDRELFYIKNFKLPETIIKIIADPASAEPFEFKSEGIPHIKGIVGSNLETGVLLFQSFDKRRVLSKKSISLILSGHTFRRLEEPGLTLDSKIVLMLLDNNLYFESYFEAARVLDLSSYYREATDADLNAFCALSCLSVASPELMRTHVDSWVRRKIAAVMESKVLERETPRKIQKEAKNFGLEFTITRHGGREQIVLPEDKKDLKNFLKFLEEDFFYTILSGTKCVSSSKKTLA